MEKLDTLSHDQGLRSVYQLFLHKNTKSVSYWISYTLWTFSVTRFMEYLITWFFWKRYLIRKVNCKNISKKIFQKDFGFILNLLVFLFKWKKNSNIFGKRKMHGCKVLWITKSLDVQSFNNKRFYIWFKFPFPT